MIHTERQLVSSFTVSHTSGIHMRPAQALTFLAQELSREHQIVTLVRNPDTTKEFRDVVLELDQARNGYGSVFDTFTEQLFLAGSTIEITVRGGAAVDKLAQALRLYERLLGDAEMLEQGGTLPRFKSEYIDTIKSF